MAGADARRRAAGPERTHGTCSPGLLCITTALASAPAPPHRRRRKPRRRERDRAPCDASGFRVAGAQIPSRSRAQSVFASCRPGSSGTARGNPLATSTATARTARTVSGRGPARGPRFAPCAQRPRPRAAARRVQRRTDDIPTCALASRGGRRAVRRSAGRPEGGADAPFSYPAHNGATAGRAATASSCPFGLSVSLEFR